MDKNKLIDEALNAVYEQVKGMGYNIAYLCVQGSTNYNLDIYTEDYMSDIDMKCFILPSFDDIYFGKKISKVYQTKYGQVEVKDIRLLGELLAKMNPTYLELLATKYFKTEYSIFTRCVRNKLDDLCKERMPLLAKAILGTCFTKLNSLTNRTESNKHIFDKFGYIPKELHHILRLGTLLGAMLDNGHTFAESLILEEQTRKLLIDIKVKGVECGVEEAKVMAEIEIDNMKKLYDRLWDGKQPRQEIKDTAITKINLFIHDLVREHIFE